MSHSYKGHMFILVVINEETNLIVTIPIYPLSLIIINLYKLNMELSL